MGGEAVDQLVGRSFGEFVLTERIGEGGFGAVYRATQEHLEREAVVKVLRSELLASETAGERFLREAKLASRFDHPYAAHIYAFGAEPDGELWIAMELVRGTPLDQLLKAQGTLSIERLSSLLDRVCEVVQSAHDQGIVHRDLKPANVMVISRAGRMLPKLLDFGIAKGLSREDDLSWSKTDEHEAVAGDLTSSGAVIGSPAYIAPEQWAEPQSVDGRADLYALGVLAYECLTGKPPFSARTLTEYALAHAERPVPPLGGRFPAALDQVFAKALAKQPEDRYRDALAFATAFRQAAGIVAEQVALPALDKKLSAAALAGAPQPIAEAVAALDAAKNVHQARDATIQLARTVARYLGLLALMCRSRVMAADEPTAVADLIRTLHLRPLTDPEWLELGRAATRPWTECRDAHPMPELVDALQYAELVDSLGSIHLLRDRDAMHEEALLEALEQAVGKMSSVLGALAFLADYPLAVLTSETTAEIWMGLRRTIRPTKPVRGGGVEIETPVLLDRDGAPVLVLAPLFQAIAPMPGEPADLFLFDGRDQRGAKLVALPAGFECHDNDVWDWLRAQLATTLDDRRATANEEVAPYRGLEPFSREHVYNFFGREQLVDAVVNRLQVQTLVAIVGPSGAGKSSFVQAGVLPALPPSWRAVTMRPGATPLAALASRLQHAGFEHEGIASDREVLGTLLRAEAAANGPVVLVIDQLEELFTLCQDADERRRFIEAVASAARAPDYPVRVVLTLRDDFLVRTEQVPALRDRIGRGLQLLTVPAAEDLVRILVEPARRGGYTFEDPDLPQEMVDEVNELPGALALLSFTALKLWELRDRHFKQLTRAAYKILGGVGGALARHADDTYNSMPPEERALAREAFRHLVTSQNTRAVLARADLRQLLGTNAHGDRVIEQLIAARLLVASENESGAETIELVHEALLTAWPRLVEWRLEDSEGARLREQLRTAAAQWHERGRRRGLLWRGDALADLARWRARHTGPLTELEAAFADASIGDAARGRRIRRALSASVFVVLAAGVIGLVVFSTQLTRQRRALRDNLERQFEDEGRKLVLQDDPLSGLAYLAKSAELGASGLAHDLLVAEAVHASDGELFEVHHDGSVRSPSLSADGSKLLTGSLDRTAKLWNAHTGALLVTLHHDSEVVFSALSPDATLALTGTHDGTATLWKLDTGKEIARVRHAKRVVCALFSADGKLGATASDDDTLVLWEIPEGKARARLTGDGAGMRACAFSADGSKIATGDAKGTLRVWDVARGKQLVELHGHRDAITAVHFAPDGDHVLTAGADNNAIVWDLRTAHSGAILSHDAAVSDARYSADGKQIITASADHTAVVWDAETGAKQHELIGHTARVAAAALSPDGTYAVTVSDDAAAWLWSVASGRVVARWRGHRDQIRSVDFDRSGARVLTASEDGSAIMWAVQPQEHVVRLVGHTAEVYTTNFSPDGLRVVTGGNDGTARIWEAATGKELQKLVEPTTKLMADAQFSPDGHTLATATDKGVIRIWDLATGSITRSLSAGDSMITQMRWSPDGALLAASAADGSLHCWDARSGKLQFANRGHDGFPIMSAVFSPDGKAIVTSADTDPNIRAWALDGHQLWAFADPSPTHVAAELDRSGTRLLVTSGTRQAKIFSLASPADVVELLGHTGFVNFATWSPDGQLVVTAAQDHTVRLWDATTGDMLAIYAHPSNVALATFSPDGKRIAFSGDDGVAEIHELPHFDGGEEALARILRCRVPVEVTGDRLRSRPVDRRGCN